MPNLPLTLFKGNYDTYGQAGTLAEVLRLIREDKWQKKHTEKYPNLNSSPANKKEAEATKKRTPCFAVEGVKKDCPCFEVEMLQS